MLKIIAVILLLAHMVFGLFIWLEDHDDNRLRVIRLGTVLGIAVLLLVFIFYSGETP